MPKNESHLPRSPRIHEVGASSTTIFDAVRGVQPKQAAHRNRQHARQAPIQNTRRHAGRREQPIIIPESKQKNHYIAKGGFWVVKNVLKATLGTPKRAKHTAIAVGALYVGSIMFEPQLDVTTNSASRAAQPTLEVSSGSEQTPSNIEGKTPLEAYQTLSPEVQQMLSATGYVPATEIPNAQPYIDKVRESGKISGYFSESIPPVQLLALSYAGGFRGEDLKHIGQIQLRESAGQPITIGDNGYRGAHRISVGLYQMTCGADGIECSGVNDPNANIDPLLSAFNAKAWSEQAQSYWGYSMRFQPWHKSGDQNLGQFENVIANAYNELQAMTSIDLAAA